MVEREAVSRTTAETGRQAKTVDNCFREAETAQSKERPKRAGERHSATMRRWWGTFNSRGNPRGALVPSRDGIPAQPRRREVDQELAKVRSSSGELCKFVILCASTQNEPRSGDKLVLGYNCGDGENCVRPRKRVRLLRLPHQKEKQTSNCLPAFCE